VRVVLPQRLAGGKCTRSWMRLERAPPVGQSAREWDNRANPTTSLGGLLLSARQARGLQDERGGEGREPDASNGGGVQVAPRLAGKTGQAQETAPRGGVGGRMAGARRQHPIECAPTRRVTSTRARGGGPAVSEGVQAQIRSRSDMPVRPRTTPPAPTTRRPSPPHRRGDHIALAAPPRPHGAAVQRPGRRDNSARGGRGKEANGFAPAAGARPGWPCSAGPRAFLSPTGSVRPFRGGEGVNTGSRPSVPGLPPRHPPATMLVLSHRARPPLHG